MTLQRELVDGSLSGLTSPRAKVINTTMTLIMEIQNMDYDKHLEEILTSGLSTKDVVTLI